MIKMDGERRKEKVSGSCDKQFKSIISSRTSTVLSTSETELNQCRRLQAPSDLRNDQDVRRNKLIGSGTFVTNAGIDGGQHALPATIDDMDDVIVDDPSDHNHNTAVASAPAAAAYDDNNIDIITVPSSSLSTSVKDKLQCSGNNEEARAESALSCEQDARSPDDIRIDIGGSSGRGCEPAGSLLESKLNKHTDQTREILPWFSPIQDLCNITNKQISPLISNQQTGFVEIDATDTISVGFTPAAASGTTLNEATTSNWITIDNIVVGYENDNTNHKDHQQLEADINGKKSARSFGVRRLDRKNQSSVDQAIDDKESKPTSTSIRLNTSNELLQGPEKSEGRLTKAIKSLVYLLRWNQRPNNHNKNQRLNLNTNSSDIITSSCIDHEKQTTCSSVGEHNTIQTEGRGTIVGISKVRRKRQDGEAQISEHYNGSGDDNKNESGLMFVDNKTTISKQKRHTEQTTTIRNSVSLDDIIYYTSGSDLIPICSELAKFDGHKQEVELVAKNTLLSIETLGNEKTNYSKTTDQQAESNHLADQNFEIDDHNVSGCEIKDELADTTIGDGNINKQSVFVQLDRVGTIKQTCKFQTILTTCRAEPKVNLSSSWSGREINAHRNNFEPHDSLDNIASGRWLIAKIGSIFEQLTTKKTIPPINIGQKLNIRRDKGVEKEAEEEFGKPRSSLVVVDLKGTLVEIGELDAGHDANLASAITKMIKNCGKHLSTKIGIKTQEPSTATTTIDITTGKDYQASRTRASETNEMDPSRGSGSAANDDSISRHQMAHKKEEEPNSKTVRSANSDTNLMMKLNELEDLESDVARNTRRKELPSEGAMDSHKDERDVWGKNIEFLLAVIGFAVDLGNVWRFPYVCYKNGGGAFLIPYTILFVLGGLPIFYMEMSLGQYFSSGCLTVWRSVCPIAKGIGYSMCILNFFTGLYYNTIISWAVYFFWESFTIRSLPWTSCNNSWNLDTCMTIEQRQYTRQVLNQGEISPDNGLNNLTMNMARNFTSPTQDYFKREVLQIHLSSGIDDLGHIRQPLALYLAIVFVFIYFAIWKGVKSTGKAVWITALLPYFILTPLLIRGVFLPGAWSGIKYYLSPQWTSVKDMNVWVEAAKQIYFSLGPGFGTLMALSSYNKFNHNTCKDALIAATVNYFASFISGFVIFSVLGYMAVMSEDDISHVATFGPGLVFEVYPEGLATMQFAALWSGFFFTMVVTLGIDSTFGGLESVITGLCDEYPRSLRRHRGIFIGILIIIIYVCSLPTTTNGGNYVIFILESYGTSSLLLIVLIETIVVCWIYGTDRFCSNLEEMSGHPPSAYWRICWKYISPTILLIIFVAACGEELSKYHTLKDDNYTYPDWAPKVGLLITGSSIICIPAYAIYHLVFKTKGSLLERFKCSFEPCSQHENHPGILDRDYCEQHESEFDDHLVSRQRNSNLPTIVTSPKDTNTRIFDEERI